MSWNEDELTLAARSLLATDDTMNTDKRRLFFIRVHLCSSVANRICFLVE